MKRLRVILLFLLMGAIVNVAVAWGCTFFVMFNNGADSGGKSIDNAFWDVLRFRAFGSTLIHSDFRNSKDTPWEDDPSIWNPRWINLPQPSSHYFRAVKRWPNDGIYEAHEFEFRGWPMHSLWCERHSLLNSNYDVVMGINSSRGAIPLYIERWQRPWLRRLPYLPVWSGFVVNTLFYTALIIALSPVPFVMRGKIRQRHGLCVKCAYDLRGVDHEACPECGEEIRKGNPA